MAVASVSSAVSEVLSMIVDPFRWYRRHQRLRREAREEVQYLRRRHGESALTAAREKLARSDLTDWGRSVVSHAIRELERAPRGI